MILDYIGTISAAKFGPSNESIPYQTPRPANVLVDWLRVTNPNKEKFEGFVRKYVPLLKGIGLEFLACDLKMNGYQKTWIVQFNDQNCGFLCGDSRMGGMLDLSAVACQLLQSRWDLWCALVFGLQEFSMRIKRCDLAFDFKGALWDSYGLNMIGLSELVVAGKFFNSNRGGGAKPVVTTLGEWLSVRKMDSSEYDPKRHCTSGLTINIGSKSSANQWCLYEKGKQLAGKNPDRYDGSLSNWIRIERRLMSGSGRSEVAIDWRALVYPDEAFVMGCTGVAELVNDWESYKVANGVEVEVVEPVGLDFERVGLSMAVSVKKAAVHVANQCGRFFKTLDDIGVDAVEFVRLVQRDEGLRGFDASVYSHFVGSGLGGRSGVSSASSELLTFLKREYGSGSDPRQLGLGLFDAGGVV